MKSMRRVSAVLLISLFMPLATAMHLPLQVNPAAIATYKSEIEKHNKRTHLVRPLVTGVSTTIGAITLCMALYQLGTLAKTGGSWLLSWVHTPVEIAATDLAGRLTTIEEQINILHSTHHSAALSYIALAGQLSIALMQHKLTDLINHLYQSDTFAWYFRTKKPEIDALFTCLESHAAVVADPICTPEKRAYHSQQFELAGRLLCDMIAQLLAFIEVKITQLPELVVRTNALDSISVYFIHEGNQLANDIGTFAATGAPADIIKRVDEFKADLERTIAQCVRATQV